MPSISTLWSHWGQRFQLVAFLISGVILAILHHLLGLYLSGKPVFHIARIPLDQPRLSSTSNAISQVVKWLFATTIGVAFAQYFWIATEKYRNNEDWPKLDAPLAAASGNPFTISAFPTWYRAPGLAFSALVVLSMILIPIFVPGSIRVVTGGIVQPCSVNSPNITALGLVSKITYSTTISLDPTDTGDPSNTTIIPSFRTSSIVNNIILSGSYMPVPSPCGVCTYRLNFTGTSMNCSSDTTFNFSTNFPSSYNGLSHLTPLWNGSLIYWTSEGYLLSVAARGGHSGYVGSYAKLLPDSPTAVKCYSYRADYDVRVQHDNFSSRIDVLSVNPRYRLFPIFPTSNNTPSKLDVQLHALVQAVVNNLAGTLTFDIESDGFSETPLNIAHTSMFHWTYPNFTTVVTLSDPATFISSLMQNVSLSLLSAQFSPYPGTETYMVKASKDCLVTQLVYEYDSRRLLGIYAAGAVIAAIFLSFGFLVIAKNEREHNLDFSHIVKQLPFSPSYTNLPQKDSE